MRIKKMFALLIYCTMATIIVTPGIGQSINRLNITFEGAIGFVPIKLDDTTYKEVWALIVKGTGDGYGNEHPNVPMEALKVGVKVPSHYSFLRIPAKNYCNEAASSCTSNPQVGEASILIPINNDDIILLASFEAQPIKKDSSLAFVPHLGAFSSHGEVCDNCVTTSDPDPDILAGRLVFMEGTFQAHNFIKDKFGNFIQWRMADFDEAGRLVSTGHELEKLAQHMILSATYSGELKVQLKGFPRKPNATTRTFRIAADGGVVNLGIINLPTTDVFGIKPPDYEVIYNRISHFALFYGLSKDKNGAVFPFPVAKEFVQQESFSIGGQPYCGNAILNR